MSSIINALHIGSSAMNVHSWGMAVSAHNVANVNTAGFNPERALYATGPQGQGVQLNAIQQFSREQNQFGPVIGPSTILQNYTGNLPAEFVHSSGTDLAREMVNMIGTQRGYEANAKVVQSSDNMLGYLLDTKA